MKCKCCNTNEFDIVYKGLCEACDDAVNFPHHEVDDYYSDDLEYEEYKYSEDPENY